MKLSVKECLSFGWNTFKARPWIFVKIAFVLSLLSILVNFVNWLVQTGQTLVANDPTLALVLGLVGIVVSLGSIYLGIVVDNMGVTKFYLNAHDNVQAARVRDLWTPEPFVKYLLTSLLVGLATLLGLILLIVPGIIVALAFGMSLFLVMDRGLGITESMKESARITRGNRLKLLLLGLALLGINLLGLLLFVVGLIVSLPISYLASVHAYRTLSKVATI